MAVGHVTGNVVKIRVSHFHSVGIRRQTHCHVTKNVTKKFIVKVHSPYGTNLAQLSAKK